MSRVQNWTLATSTTLYYNWLKQKLYQYQSFHFNAGFWAGIVVPHFHCIPTSLGFC